MMGDLHYLPRRESRTRAAGLLDAASWPSAALGLVSRPRHRSATRFAGS
jgi:hypothetical protein